MAFADGGIFSTDISRLFNYIISILLPVAGGFRRVQDRTLSLRALDVVEGNALLTQKRIPASLRPINSCRQRTRNLRSHTVDLRVLDDDTLVQVLLQP